MTIRIRWSPCTNWRCFTKKKGITIRQNSYYSKPLKADALNSVTPTHTLKSLNNLIELYEAWGKPEKANEWRAKLPQAENIRKRHSPPNGPIFLTYKASEFLDKACQQNVSTDLDFSII